MDYKQILQVCLDFSLPYHATITTFPDSEVKLSIDSRTDGREIHVECGVNSLWYVDVIDSVTGNRISFQSVETEEMLRDTLVRAWAHTPVHAAASLIDAKLADLHARLERHTEALDRLLDGMQRLENLVFACPVSDG